MKLAANLGTMWRELPYLDRFDAAARSGFAGVAVPLPYDVPAKETKRAALACGLHIVQISAPPPNYTGGERGFAAHIGAERRFAYDLRRALRYADVLRVPMLHVMAGQGAGDAARDTLIANLSTATKTLPEGVTLTVQPQDQDGAFLNNYAAAKDVIDAVGSNALGIQYHSRHAEALHGDAARVFAHYADVIRHVQIGDFPAGPPGTGCIDFDAVFSEIARAGYAGWIVADYTSDEPTENTLEWMSMLRR